jgi:hypothetical protein
VFEFSVNWFNQQTGAIVMREIYSATSFEGDGYNLTALDCGEHLCFRIGGAVSAFGRSVLTTIEDETRFYNILRDRNDARVMADIEAAKFPRYLSSEEAWVVLRSPSKKNDEDLCSGVAINQSIPGRVVYDPGLYVESFENLELRNNSWCLLDGDDSSASNLVGKTFDRWTPPAPIVIEEPIAPVNQSEVIANLNKSVLDASNEDLQFVIDTLKAVIAARGDL